MAAAADSTTVRPRAVEWVAVVGHLHVVSGMPLHSVLLWRCRRSRRFPGLLRHTRRRRVAGPSNALVPVFTCDPRLDGPNVGEKILDIGCVGVPPFGTNATTHPPLRPGNALRMNHDLTLFKNVRVARSAELQFRAGFFNIFNTAYATTEINNDVDLPLDTVCNRRVDHVPNGIGGLRGWCVRSDRRLFFTASPGRISARSTSSAATASSSWYLKIKPPQGLRLVHLKFSISIRSLERDCCWIRMVLPSGDTATRWNVKGQHVSNAPEHPISARSVEQVNRPCRAGTAAGVVDPGGADREVHPRRTATADARDLPQAAGRSGDPRSLACR